MWTDTAPQRANFRAWTEIICNDLLPGDTNKERRGALKNASVGMDILQLADTLKIRDLARCRHGALVDPARLRHGDLIDPSGVARRA